MKMFLVVLCLIAAATAAPNCVDSKTAALRAQPALQYDETRDENGQYSFRYVTAEGTIVSQRGRLVASPEGCGDVLVIDGETSYIGDDGKTYSTKYTAGLDGFHVEGAHLPVPVPLPAYVPISEGARKPNSHTAVATSVPVHKQNPCVEVATSAPVHKKNPCVQVATSAPVHKQNPCVEVATSPPVHKPKPCVEVATSAPVHKQNPCVEIATSAPVHKQNPCVEVATSAPVHKKNPCVSKHNSCE